MIEFLLLDANFPFSLSLAILLSLAALEGFSLLLGLGFSTFLDTFIPDFDIPDGDIPNLDSDMDIPGAGGSGFATELLVWLRIKEVPIFVTVLTFLASFGLAGIIFQLMLLKTLGLTLPALIAAPIAFFACLPVVRISTGLFSKILPKDETSAVSTDSFIGRTATIVLGTAKKGSPVQARLKDEHGQSHYIMVEPDNAGEEFSKGGQVLIVKKQGNNFSVIESPEKLKPTQI